MLPSLIFAAAVTGERIPFFTPEFTIATLEQLLKIDSVVDPGVTEDQFLQLFAMCRACRTYMTRRTTTFHNCTVDPGAANRIFDLIDLSDLEV
jgi:hypothetical protein